MKYTKHNLHTILAILSVSKHLFIECWMELRHASGSKCAASLTSGCRRRWRMCWQSCRRFPAFIALAHCPIAGRTARRRAIRDVTTSGARSKRCIFHHSGEPRGTAPTTYRQNLPLKHTWASLTRPQPMMRINIHRHISAGLLSRPVASCNAFVAWQCCLRIFVKRVNPTRMPNKLQLKTKTWVNE